MMRGLGSAMCVLSAMTMISAGIAVIIDAPEGGVVNRSASTVGTKHADLLPVNIWTIPSSPTCGQPAEISSQIQNQGNGAAGVSFTNTLRIDSILVSNQTLDSLSTGATGPAWFATAIVGPGYHLLASTADEADVIPESAETNNQIQTSCWWASPDLEVASIDICQDGSFDTAIVAGEPFEAIVTVINYGDAGASVSVVQLVDVFNSSTTVLGTSQMEALGPGHSSQINFSSLFLNTTGSHTIRAMADSADSVQEANKATGVGAGTGEDNNLRDSSCEVVLEWLVMIYRAYESNWDSQVDWALAHDPWYVGPSSNIKIVTEIDRLSDWNGSGNSNTRVYEIANHSAIQVADLGELNMGAPATLSSFVTWATTSYPAKKRLLMLSDHGDGWRGVCYDYSDPLNMTELKTSLHAAWTETAAMIDVMMFDACLMAELEVAYQIKDYARLMVGSESESYCLPTELLFYDLLADPTITTEEMGAMLVRDFSVPRSLPDIEFCGCSRPISALSLTTIDAITASVEVFAQCMLDRLVDYRQAVQDCANATTRYDGETEHPFVDLYHFIDLVNQSSLPRDLTLQTAMDQIRTGIDAAVIEGNLSGDFPNSHGISIYLPDDRSELQANADSYSTIDFAALGAPSWAAFLKVLLEGYSPIANFTYSVGDHEISLDASSSWDPDGTVERYSWDFGDGTSGSGQQATHSYASEGPYTIVLIVRDDSYMCSDPVAVVVLAPGPNRPPTMAMTYEAVDLTVACRDDSSDPDGYVVSVWWDWGDGSWESGTDVTHTYAQAGTYQLLHYANDDHDVWGYETVNITVAFNSPPSTPGVPMITPGDELDGTFELRWTPSIDSDTFPVGGYYLIQRVRIDGVWSGWTNVSLNIPENRTTQARPPGSYVFAVCAFDTAHPPLWSSWASMSSIWPIVVPEDSDPPVTAATVCGSPGDNGWFVSEATVTLSASDPSSVEGTFYRIDDESMWTTYASPFRIPSDGTHAIYYYSVDGLGNMEAIRNTSVWIDQTPPLTTASVRIKGLTATVTLTISDSTSLASATYYSLDGGASWQVYTGSFQITGKGSHIAHFYSLDNAGNEEVMKSTTFQI